MQSCFLKSKWNEFNSYIMIIEWLSQYPGMNSQHLEKLCKFNINVIDIVTSWSIHLAITIKQSRRIPPQRIICWWYDHTLIPVFIPSVWCRALTVFHFITTKHQFQFILIAQGVHRYLCQASVCRWFTMHFRYFSGIFFLNHYLSSIVSQQDLPGVHV